MSEINVEKMELNAFSIEKGIVDLEEITSYSVELQEAVSRFVNKMIGIDTDKIKDKDLNEGLIFGDSLRDKIEYCNYNIRKSLKIIYQDLDRL